MARIPLAAAEKLLRQKGEERISQDAKSQLREILEQEAKDLGRKAVDMAKHAKRKTVLEQDITFVLKTDERK